VERVMNNVVQFKPKRAAGINGSLDRITELLRSDKVKLLAVVCVTEDDEFMVRHEAGEVKLGDVARLLLIVEKVKETVLGDVDRTDREEG